MPSSAGASLAEIERVYRARFLEFHRLATAVVDDAEVARDVVQDAFAAIVRGREGFSALGSLDAWAWRVVLNTALNRKRSARRDRDRLVKLAATNGHDKERAPDVVFEAALRSLPEQQRLIVFLRYYADLDYAGIADTLGISAGTVGSTLHSAHQALRQRLDEEGTR
jgi:RNA polymerase sigma factor (sigma-70 family)